MIKTAADRSEFKQSVNKIFFHKNTTTPLDGWDWTEALGEFFFGRFSSKSPSGGFFRRCFEKFSPLCFGGFFTGETS